MSHSPERKEKDCLNCGALVRGRYCHVCGQENKVPRESFWALVVHFFYDITHFDSSFFDTMKYLLLRPGFLPKEYMTGRRARYLNPIRMYIFTSAFFFLIFFAFISPKQGFITGDNNFLSQAQRDSLENVVNKKLQKDSTDLKQQQLKILLADTSNKLTTEHLINFNDDFTMINFAAEAYKSSAQYDSVQNALPASKRDGWLKRTWIRKELAINEKYRNDPKSALDTLGNAFLHRLPYLLFISLPFFALILKLLYTRRNWYYVDHVIFSVYHYIVSFFLLLFIFAFNALRSFTGWSVFNLLIAATIFIWVFYLYKAMRRFYQQGRIKTFTKFVLLNILGFVCLVLLLIFFILFSIFQI